jgi:hypothetical protein
MRTPVCRYGHPLIDRKSKSMVLDYHVDGHVWQTCCRCEPNSYAFGVAMKSHRMITFYAITGKQHREGKALPDMDTIDILTFLGYGRQDDDAA